MSIEEYRNPNAGSPLRNVIPEVKMNFGWNRPDKSSLHTTKSGKLRTLKGYERAVAMSKKRERPDEMANAERGGTEYGSLFRREGLIDLSDPNREARLAALAKDPHYIDQARKKSDSMAWLKDHNKKLRLARKLNKAKGKGF